MRRLFFLGLFSFLVVLLITGTPLRSHGNKIHRLPSEVPPNRGLEETDNSLFEAKLIPNVTKCCKYVTIQNVSQILSILVKTKSGRIFHKSSVLLPLNEKNFSHSFLLIPIRNIVFKRDQVETRFFRKEPSENGLRASPTTIQLTEHMTIED